jgi:DNA-binding transcriptional MerR regulator
MQAARIVGMSTHMLNYLARYGYLVPTYFRSGRRGKTRYYSYRDLVIARLVQKLLDAGLELSRLKDGLKKLPRDENWSDAGPQRNLRLLATDGKNLYFLQARDTLLDLTRHGQLAFAFVLDISAARQDVELQLTADQLAGFTFANRRIKYA